MASADHGGQAPDSSQLLGVAREASREEIALSWRRRPRPVRVDRPRLAPPAATRDQDALRLAVWAELARRYLGRPW